MLSILAAIVLTPHGPTEQVKVKGQARGIRDVGLPAMNDEGLIPLHDVHIDGTPGASLKGHFYVGGKFSDWEEKPKIFLSSFSTSDFNPASTAASKWVPCSPVTFTTGAFVDKEGSRIDFSCRFPSGVDVTHFWIAVQLRGISLEGVDEISVAANTYKPMPPRGLLRIKVKNGPDDLRTNAIVPITWIRPYLEPEFLDKPKESHRVYTNQGNFNLTGDLYVLKGHAATPQIGQAWVRATNPEVGAPPEADNARRHLVRFKNGDGKHYLFVSHHDSSVGGSDPVHEWSGVIRPPQ